MQKICLQYRVQELSTQPLAHLLPALGLEVAVVTLVQTGNARGSSQSTWASLCVFSEVGFLQGAASACSQSCGVSSFPPLEAVAAATQIPLVRSVMTRAFTSFLRNSFSRWMLCVQDWKKMRETGGQQLAQPSMLLSLMLGRLCQGHRPCCRSEQPLHTKDLLSRKADTVSRIRPVYLRKKVSPKAG